MRRLSFTLALLPLAALPLAARAQGTLSTQGFGYPTGQISTRSLGAGGALAEIDPLSVTNPAALLNFGGSALYFQAEPEYRTLHVGGTSERTTIARYPLVAASIPLTSTLYAGLSLSSLLDRSFQTTVRGSYTLSDTTIGTTNVFQSNGAIGDVRAALAWAPWNWMHLGVAAHAITGDNRLTSTQTFDDTIRFARQIDTLTVTYTGKAYSAGVELYAGSAAAFAASYRRGGTMSLKHGDTTISQARVPDRLSLSAAYLGLRGSTIAVRTSHEQWTDMAGLGSPALRITDNWDTSVGADVVGPALLGRTLQLRAGGRWRTLPFGVLGADVKETSFSFGTGMPLARGRAALDLAGIHASRTASSTSATESAWTLSVGITVRP
ncbi:MAG TPA: hypothetical protein VGG84_01335 [Gemmatimonadaceae bacterium]